MPPDGLSPVMICWKIRLVATVHMSADDPSSSLPKGEGPFNRQFLAGFFGGLVVSFVVWSLGGHYFIDTTRSPHAYFLGGPFNHSVLLVLILELCKFTFGIYLWFMDRWKKVGLGLLVSAVVGGMIFVGVCAFVE